MRAREHDARRRRGSGWARRPRVPVIRQREASECGVACVAMLASWHGRDVALEDCRRIVPPSRSGADASRLAALAESLGLRMTAHALPEPDFRAVALPCVLHWRFNHFVVLERVRDGVATIVDPAAGRRRVGARELDESFTGVVLHAAPRPSLVPADRPRRRLRRRATARPARRRLRPGALLLAALRAARVGGLLARVLAAAFVLQLLALAFPLLMRAMFDYVIPWRMDDLRTTILVGVVVLFVAVLVIGLLRSALLVHLRARFDGAILLGFLDHVLALPFETLQLRGSGDLLHRLTSTYALRELLAAQTVSALVDGLAATVFLVALLAIEPLVGLVVLCLAVAQIAVVLLSWSAVERHASEALRRESRSQSYALELLGGVASLKAAGATGRAARHWTGLFYAQQEADSRSSALAGAVQALTTALTVATPLVALWFASGLVIDQRLTPGSMLAVVLLSALFVAPLTRMVSALHSAQAAVGHLERLAEILAEEPEPVSPPGAWRALEGRLDIRGVTFSYLGGERPVLRDVSFTVPAGAKIAIVGASGSGKTTLVHVLLGLLEPDDGEILVDGVPLASWPRDVLRTQLGVVLQEPWLFSGTIRENLAFGWPEAGEHQLLQACDAAGLAGDLATLPLGLDTLLSEGGAGLSGGQRQRLCLARALVGEPRMLLLDEATSHLDAVTEAAVEARLDALGITRVVVAHRLSTVRTSDLIVLLRDGTVAEIGTHDELVTDGGAYAELVRAQAEEPVPG